MKATYSKTLEKPSGFLFARWSAGAKAFEQLLAPDKRTLNDIYAHYYAGQVGRDMVATMMHINPSIRKAIVLRARFMDDYSIKCLNDGFEQVVVLGAGYDSRFLRLNEFHQVKVFELDLYSTQIIKKTLTRRLMGSLPDNVTYVSIDFSKDSIVNKLIDAGFNKAKKTLFIWEGVTLFLNEDIISENLSRLSDLGTGNRITFDFIPSELIDDETEYEGNRKLVNLCASINEPLTFGCSPEKCREILAGTGFAKVDIMDMREANKIYSGTDRIEDSYYFVTAEVGKSDNENFDKKNLIISP